MKKKLLATILSFCMIISLLPMTALAADDTFSDTSGHWAADAIENWAERGVLKGSEGLFRPNDPIKRAELAAMLSRIIGYTETTNTAFADVPSDAWYYSDVQRLYAAGIMQGDGAGTMRPETNITREEAVVLIARAFNVEENAGNESPFPDAGEIAGWASFLVDGMKAAGYISGDTNGNFNPKTNITRAEVATVINNMITFYFNTSDARDCELVGEIDANALINTASATVQNLYINGSLWMTEGVGNGDVTLENVTVNGTTYIRGGGPSSIHMTGGSFTEIRLNAKTAPHLDLSKETRVERVYLDNTASVSHDGVTVNYEAATDTVTFGGTIDKVELNADGTATVTIGGMVYDVIPPEGTVTRFELAKDAVIGLLVTNGPVHIGGTGEIKKAEIHKDGVVIDKTVNVKPEDVTVDDGVKIIIGDKEYTGEGKPLPKENTNTGGGGGSYNPPAATYTFNTPAAITANGVTATVTFDKVSPQAAGAAVKATVTLSGTATKAGEFTIDLTSTKAGLTTSEKTKAVTAGATPTDAHDFTLTMPSGNVDDLTLVFHFVETTYDLTIGNLSTQAAVTYGVASITTGSATGNTVNASVTVTAVPTANHVFVGWVATDSRTATLVSTDTAYTFNINADTTLYAIFNGDGSVVGAPVEITTKEGLEAISNGLDKHYKLMSDLILSTWTPIGTAAAPFTGSFDGSRKTITFDGDTDTAGIQTVSLTGVQRAGLFGYVNSANAIIKNITVEGALASNYTAANCALGGVVGFLSAGTVENCASSAAISLIGAGSYRTYTGGLIGYISDSCSVKNSCATGAVTASGGMDNIAGGLVGQIQSSTIENCYAIGNAAATGGNAFNQAGGLVGHVGDFAGNIKTSYAAGNATASGTGKNHAGGVVGSANGNIESCVALGVAVSASGGSSNNAGRVTNKTVGTLINNRVIDTMTVMVMGDTPAKTHDGKDGLDLTVTNSQLQTTYSTAVNTTDYGAGGLGWLFGTNDDNPWVWSNTLQRPVLWFEI